MMVDILTEITIARPVNEVAAFAMDPDNVSAWYENIKSAEWKTAKPLTGGDAVFKARALYALINDTVYDDIALCDTGNPDDRMLMIKHVDSAAVTDTMPTIYKLYPNPAKDEVKIISNNPFAVGSKLIIYNAEGQLLVQHLLPGGQYQTQINIVNLPPASYIAVIATGNENRFRTKLMIMK